MRPSDLSKVLFHGSLAVLVFLSVGLLVTSASADSAPSSLLQNLPTRPSDQGRPTSAPSPQPPPSRTEPASSPSTPTPTPVAVSLPTPQVTVTQTTSPGALLSQSVDLSFEELGYGTFQLSESGWRWISLHLPHNLVPINDRSYLELTISHVPPEPDKHSVIKATFNNAPLAVVTLSPENAEPTTYRFYLGNTPLIPGRNSLQVLLDAGAGCNIRGAMVDVAVYASSLFHLEYSLTQPHPDLALYPLPFFEWSFKYDPVYVVLPDDPSPTDLSAAATIAAGLGQSTDGQVRLISVSDTQIPVDIRANHHLIVVGKIGSNRFLDQLDLPLPLDDPTLSDEQGVIQELISPWNPLHMILVIASRSDEGVTKASQALNRETHLLSMRGPVAIVQAVLPPELTEDRQPDADFTLADLGYAEEIVHGTAPHTLEYRFYMPLGWTITDESRFTLYFGHARIASPASSSLDVRFNGVPIGSVLLDESNASEGTLEVALPSWLIRPGRNEIRLSIEMNLEDEDKCLFLDTQNLWTAIYSHSYFHLPFIPRDVDPSLDLFPYPFNKEPNLSDVLMILSDHPRQLEVDLMLDMAVGLGAADQGGCLALDVTTADLVTQENLQDKDLVLIGRPTAHSLIAELNDDLPQPFKPGSDLLSPKLESVVFVQDPARDIGLIEELPAPWDSERTILVLTGTTDEGIALASAELVLPSGALAGNVALVEESIGVRAFDTRPMVSEPDSVVKKPDASQSPLARLGERWW
jgi:hypothetical protein